MCFDASSGQRNTLHLYGIFSAPLSFAPGREASSLAYLARRSAARTNPRRLACHAARANVLATSSFVELKVGREGVQSSLQCARECRHQILSGDRGRRRNRGLSHLFSSPRLLLVDQEGCRRLWVSLGRP